MKRKEDFVTNSSSTSFIVYGYNFSADEVKNNKKLMEKIFIYETTKEKYPNDITREEFFNEDLSFYELEDMFFHYVKDKYGFEGSSLESGDSLAVGVSPFKMKNEETYSEFKKRIEDNLNEMVEDENRKITPYAIEEGWYNG